MKTSHCQYQRETAVPRTCTGTESWLDCWGEKVQTVSVGFAVLNYQKEDYRLEQLISTLPRNHASRLVLSFNIRAGTTFSHVSSLWSIQSAYFFTEDLGGTLKEDDEEFYISAAIAKDEYFKNRIHSARKLLKNATEEDVII